MVNKAERNYCITLRELIAILMTLKHFHKYLYGEELHLRTDHSTLNWLISFMNKDGQTDRSILRLQQDRVTS